MTTDAPTITADLHRSQTLWRARWHPATDDYAGCVTGAEKLPHTAAREIEWTGRGGGLCRRVVRTWTVPLEEGAVFLRSDDDDRRGAKLRYAVVRGGQIVELTKVEAEDLLDPAGATERAEVRAMLPYYKEKRGRGAILTPGRTYQRPSGDFIYVTWARRWNYRFRNATPREIAAWHAQQQAEEPMSPTP
jgi:hypothetical protein